MPSADKQATFTIAASQLAAAAAAVPSGQWDTWTIGNTFNPDPTGVGDTILSYCQRGVWDATRKKMQFFGGSHGAAVTAQRAFLATYNDNTNTWDAPVSVPGMNTTFEHAYYNQAVDPVSGVVYMRGAFSSAHKRFDQNTRSFLADWSVPSFGTNYGICLEHHPNISGGSIIWGHYWGIARRQPSAGSWTNITTSQLMGDQGPVSAFNGKDNCIYFGGGHGAGAGQFTRLDASLNLTSRAPCPVTLDTWDAGASGDVSMLLRSGNSANRLVCVSKNGNIREYDEVADSWSGVIGTVPTGLSSPGVNQGGDWFLCSCPTYQCILGFKLASMSAMSTTGYIWKR